MRYFEFDDYYALIAVPDEKDAKLSAIKVYEDTVSDAEGVKIHELSRDEALVKYVRSLPDDKTFEILERFNNPQREYDGILLMDGSLA